VTRRWGLTTIGIGAILLAGACSSGSSPSASSAAAIASSAPVPPVSSSPGGASSDACSLLTQAEVSAAVGAPVGPGTAGDDPRTCNWEYIPAGGTGPKAQASIDIESASFDSLCKVPSNASIGLTMIPLSGVGDAACIAELTGMLPVLTFEKNGRTYSTSVGLGNVPVATTEAAEKAMAVAAAARL
jgi:hypothetical protein